MKNPVNQYVSDFVQHMNPIMMLTAGDVMKPGAADSGTVVGTVQPDAPLSSVLDAMAKTPGVTGVVENGAVVGTISAQDILEGLTRHRRRDE